jgi:4-amino-4-deoxy-L-arabinose transferase-like glycosyltransferase
MRGEYRADGEPELLRPPGYPLLLVPGVLLGNVELVTIAMQIVLSAATGWLVYKLARLLFESHKAGVWAVLVYALEPLSVVFTVKLMSEMLFTFLLVLGIYWLCYHIHYCGWLSLLGSTLSFVACVYVRPISYYLPIVIFLFLLVGADWHVSRIGIAKGALFLVISGVLIGAWQVRNYIQAGYPQFSSSQDLNLWLNSLAVLAKERKTNFLKEKAKMGGGPVGYWKLHPEQLQWPMTDRLVHLRRQGLGNLARRPLLYVGIHLAGSVRMLVYPGSRNVIQLFIPRANQDAPGWVPLTIILAVTLFATYFVAVIGCFGIAEGRACLLLLLLGMVAYFSLLSGGPVASGRFRVPVMPIFCVLAGAGIVKLLGYAEGKTARSR